MSAFLDHLKLKSNIRFPWFKSCQKQLTLSPLPRRFQTPSRKIWIWPSPSVATTWSPEKKTQNLTKMELYLMWYGTVGVYLEHNGINMEGWYQVGTFGRTNMEEIMPTNPGGSVVNFFEWGISREKTPRWLLSIRLNSDDFPAWKLNTYLCYVTIICISRSILYYSTLKKTSRCMQDCIRAYVIISPLLQNNILYTKHRINL